MLIGLTQHSLQRRRGRVSRPLTLQSCTASVVRGFPDAPCRNYRIGRVLFIRTVYRFAERVKDAARYGLRRQAFLRCVKSISIFHYYTYNPCRLQEKSIFLTSFSNVDIIGSCRRNRRGDSRIARHRARSVRVPTRTCMHRWHGTSSLGAKPIESACKCV